MAVTCGALVATAWGAGGQLTVEQGEYRSGAAACGADKRATGGGFRSAADSRWEVLGLGPAARRWVVSLDNRGSSGPQTATLAGLCAPEAGLRTVRNTFEWTAGPGVSNVEKTIRARCPEGSRLAGGGFRPIVGPAHPNMITSAPISRRTWFLDFYASTSNPGTYTFTAVAVCDRRGRYAISSRSKEFDPPRAVPRRGTAVPFDVVSPCPGGTSLSAGGFSSGGDLNPRWERVAPKGEGYRVGGMTYSSQPITAYALCRR